MGWALVGAGVCVSMKPGLSGSGSLNQCLASLANRHVGEGYTIPCLSSEAIAYVGWGWLLLPGSEWHSCCLSSPPQTGQD